MRRARSTEANLEIKASKRAGDGIHHSPPMRANTTKLLSSPRGSRKSQLLNSRCGAISHILPPALPSDGAEESRTGCSQSSDLSCGHGDRSANGRNVRDESLDELSLQIDDPRAGGR